VQEKKDPNPVCIQSDSLEAEAIAPGKMKQGAQSESECSRSRKDNAYEQYVAKSLQEGYFAKRYNKDGDRTRDIDSIKFNRPNNVLVNWPSSPQGAMLLEIKEVPGDGNCLIRSMLYFMNPILFDSRERDLSGYITGSIEAIAEQEEISQLKERLAMELTTHPEKYQDFLTDGITIETRATEFRNDKEFLDEMAIFVLQNITGMKFIVLKIDKKDITTGTLTPMEDYSHLVSNYNEIHFLLFEGSWSVDENSNVTTVKNGHFSPLILRNDLSAHAKLLCDTNNIYEPSLLYKINNHNQERFMIPEVKLKQYQGFFSCGDAVSYTEGKLGTIVAIIFRFTNVIQCLLYIADRQNPDDDCNLIVLDPQTLLNELKTKPIQNFLSVVQNNINLIISKWKTDFDMEDVVNENEPRPMDSQSDYDWVEISDTELDANEKFADCELVQQAPTTVILDPPKPTEIPNSNELVLQTFAQDPDTSIRQNTPPPKKTPTKLDNSNTNDLVPNVYELRRNNKRTTPSKSITNLAVTPIKRIKREGKSTKQSNRKSKIQIKTEPSSKLPAEKKTGPSSTIWICFRNDVETKRKVENIMDSRSIPRSDQVQYSKICAELWRNLAAEDKKNFQSINSQRIERNKSKTNTIQKIKPILKTPTKPSVKFSINGNTYESSDYESEASAASYNNTTAPSTPLSDRANRSLVRDSNRISNASNSKSHRSHPSRLDFNQFVKHPVNAPLAASAIDTTMILNVLQTGFASLISHLQGNNNNHYKEKSEVNVKPTEPAVVLEQTRIYPSEADSKSVSHKVSAENKMKKKSRKKHLDEIESDNTDSSMSNDESSIESGSFKRHRKRPKIHNRKKMQANAPNSGRSISSSSSNTDLPVKYLEQYAHNKHLDHELRHNERTMQLLLAKREAEQNFKLIKSHIKRI
jgi:hypothetical protein